MYPMAKFSAIMWLNTLMAAQQGDEDEQENLQAENKMRAEIGYLSVEEEMQDILGNK